MPAELAVGIEGVWGLLICALALPILSATGGAGGAPFDSFPLAMAQLRASPPLLARLFLGVGCPLGGRAGRVRRAFKYPGFPSALCPRASSDNHVVPSPVPAVLNPPR